MKKCVYPNNILIVGNDGYTDSCPLETANLRLEDINQEYKNPGKVQSMTILEII